jgi:C_GCAxxG_C_C family probable redox protein
MPEETVKEELLDRIEKTAHDYEKKYHGCSRCVLKAIQENMKIGDPTSLKGVTPLAAGVAMRGETCGALLGGLVALGIVTASEDFGDEGAMTNSISLGFRLTRRIEKEFGSTKCTEIQKSKLGKSYSLADPNQYQEFIAASGYVECPKVVGKVARITADFIHDYLAKQKNS